MKHESVKGLLLEHLGFCHEACQSLPQDDVGMIMIITLKIEIALKTERSLSEA